MWPSWPVQARHEHGQCDAVQSPHTWYATCANAWNSHSQRSMEQCECLNLQLRVYTNLDVMASSPLLRKCYDYTICYNIFTCCYNDTCGGGRLTHTYTWWVIWMIIWGTAHPNGAMNWIYSGSITMKRISLDFQQVHQLLSFWTIKFWQIRGLGHCLIDQQYAWMAAANPMHIILNVLAAECELAWESDMTMANISE